MSNIVYFLGAGCSKNFGYPLTSEIMPAIIDNLHNNDCFQLNDTKTTLEKEQENDLLVRDIRDSNLLQIWKAAMEALRTADQIVFIGYSLPAEDFAIK